jgi:hypothetical protein
MSMIDLIDQIESERTQLQKRNDIIENKASEYVALIRQYDIPTVLKTTEIPKNWYLNIPTAYEKQLVGFLLGECNVYNVFKSKFEIFESISFGSLGFISVIFPVLNLIVSDYNIVAPTDLLLWLAAVVSFCVTPWVFYNFILPKRYIERAKPLAEKYLALELARLDYINQLKVLIASTEEP